jgi:hypothetical protein
MFKQRRFPTKVNQKEESEPNPFVAHCGLLDFQCKQRWDLMKATDRDDVRFCDKCDHNVYLCITEEQYLDHRDRGDCVALDMATASPAKSAKFDVSKIVRVTPPAFTRTAGMPPPFHPDQ